MATAPTNIREALYRLNGFTGAFGGGAADTWARGAGIYDKIQGQLSGLAKVGASAGASASGFDSAWNKYLAANGSAGTTPLSVASLNDAQKNALSGLTKTSTTVDPAIAATLGQAGQAIGGIQTSYNPSSAQNFLDPYIRQVIDANEADTIRTYDARRSQLNDDLARNGSFGSTAQGVEQAALTQAQNRQLSSDRANLLSNGFNTATSNAMNAFQMGNNAALAKGQAYGSLAGQQQGLDQYGQTKATTGYGAQLGAGNQIQGQNQAQLDSYYGNQTAQQQYPFQQLNFLTGLYGAYPTATTQTTKTPVNLLGTAAGAGLTYAAFASDIRLKDNIKHVGVRGGVNLYEFNYKGSPKRYRGVLAQEVAETHPESVIYDGSGFYKVNYAALPEGVNFGEVV